MIRGSIILFSLTAAAACSGSPKRVDDRPLVTRPTEPMVPRPARMGAARVQVEPDITTAVEQMLSTESSSNEIMALTGLRWTDGRMSVVAAHVRYPQQDMTEAELSAAVDDDRLLECDTEYQDCADGLESCREDAYESCIRAAYRDPYVYMSSHLGMECGTLELSAFAVEGNAVSLHDRRTLEVMLCDHDSLGASPSAADIDGDGGPELVYVWAGSRGADWRDQLMRETVVVVDANDLHEQFRLARDTADYDAEGGESVTGLTTQARNGDTFFDLTSNVVDRRGYCAGYGWALDARFVIPEDTLAEDEACEIEIRQDTHRYDVERDSWMPAEEKP